jgi:hypothetical protein
MPADLVNVTADGAQAAADGKDVRSPETSIGIGQHLSASSDPKPDGSKLYSAPGQLGLNQWGLAGRWALRGEKAVLVAEPGRIVFRFHARDLHLVLGARDAGTGAGKPVRFRISLDGAAPGADHGADTDEQGYGTVVEHRLYQLIRQKHAIADRTFTIEFLDPGVQAFSFTFG